MRCCFFEIRRSGRKSLWTFVGGCEFDPLKRFHFLLKSNASTFQLSLNATIQTKTQLMLRATWTAVHQKGECESDDIYH